MKQTFHAFVLSALLATCLNTAHAQSDASAVSMLSAMPIASIVAETGASAKDASALPAAFSLAGATLSIVAVEASATGTVYVLERVSDGARASVRVLSKVAGHASQAVGTAVVVSTIATGVVLSAAGQVLAFIPNAVGKALLHNEQVTR